MKRMTGTHKDKDSLAQANCILIVDDDVTTCQVLELTLFENGYRTTTATNGRDALCQVQTVEPDLIILDVMMPEMDGWELVESLREMTDVPVLFLTALGSGDYAARALQYPATDYMRKPFSTRELLMRVELLIGRDRNSPAQLSGQWSKLQRNDLAAIVAIIPAYNEERFIGSVVVKARKYARTVIVIDDGSSDATAEVARDAGALVLSHPANQGKGAALNTAFRMLHHYHPKVVVMLDGDGQHLPEELTRVVEPVLRGEADIVVGSRYLEKKSRVPLHRIAGHRVFNWITGVASGVSVSDSQSGYRAFSPRAVEAISFHSNDFSVESEMQFIIRQNNLRFVEIPITIRYDDQPKRLVITHGLIVLNGILRLVGQYRPLLFFALPGLLLMISGSIWGIWVMDIYSRVQVLATGYAMISALLSVTGLIMLSTGVILHSIRGLLVGMLHSRKTR